jgi:hypothetical protein
VWCGVVWCGVVMIVSSSEPSVTSNYIIDLLNIQCG